MKWMVFMVLIINLLFWWCMCFKNCCLLFMGRIRMLFLFNCVMSVVGIFGGVVVIMIVLNGVCVC